MNTLDWKLPDEGEGRFGKRSIMSLGPGVSSGSVSTMVTIPRTVAPGAYFIGAIAGNSTNFDPTGITICLSLLKPTLLSPKNRGIKNKHEEWTHEPTPHAYYIDLNFSRVTLNSP